MSGLEQSAGCRAHLQEGIPQYPGIQEAEEEEGIVVGQMQTPLFHLTCQEPFVGCGLGSRYPEGVPGDLVVSPLPISSSSSSLCLPEGLGLSPGHRAGRTDVCCVRWPCC